MLPGYHGVGSLRGDAKQLQRGSTLARIVPRGYLCWWVATRLRAALASVDSGGPCRCCGPRLQLAEASGHCFGGHHPLGWMRLAGGGPIGGPPFSYSRLGRLL